MEAPGTMRERERERERERAVLGTAWDHEREGERERALLGTFHNDGSRASPAHGLHITILTESGQTTYGRL
jgi:hypothetical protein